MGALCPHRLRLNVSLVVDGSAPALELDQPPAASTAAEADQQVAEESSSEGEDWEEVAAQAAADVAADNVAPVHHCPFCIADQRVYLITFISGNPWKGIIRGHTGAFAPQHTTWSLVLQKIGGPLFSSGARVKRYDTLSAAVAAWQVLFAKNKVPWAHPPIEEWKCPICGSPDLIDA